jgi:hypothetical protein
MTELLGGVPANANASASAAQEGIPSSRRPRGRLALELVAMRGRDVVGVRHLQDGGTAWLGNVTDSLARVSMREYGGDALILGEVRSGTYSVRVPPRARARVHGGDGVPRLVVGPYRIELRPGERAVVVLGAVQIRAQVVPFDVPLPRFKLTAGAAVWMALLGAVYVVAIALTAAAAQPKPRHAEPAAPERAEQQASPAP